MSKAHGLAFLMTMIAVLMVGLLLSVEVEAQATVDDSAWCESSMLHAAVDVIREEFKDVKNLFGSIQQQSRPMELSTQDPASSLSCEYRSVIRNVI